MWSYTFLYELWAGERLVLEKAVHRDRRPGRPISVSGSSWSRHWYLALLSLHWGCDEGPCALPGGLVSFQPCNIGANHCRLRHIGWEKCGHGLNLRRRETSSVNCLNELLVLLAFPPWSGAALLEGTLPLR